jgi:hypothetical protein
MPPPPRFCQGSDGLAHFKSHEHGLQRGFSTGTGSLNTAITPSPAYRSSVPLYLMIFSPTAAWYSRSSACPA